MSKIGKLPIAIPEGVSVSVEDGTVVISSAKGTLSQSVGKEITVRVEDRRIVVGRGSDSKKVRALHGTVRALLGNMVKGVTEGFQKTLILSGVGFRAEVEGNVLSLSVGFSHKVKVAAPEHITFSVFEDRITVSGIDKQLVGEVAERIRKVKPPEPYKGKGIRYATEVIRRKVGKKAVTG